MRMPVSTKVATVPADTDWAAIAPSQTAQLLGATGAAGDILSRLVCVVATPATAQVQIRDGSTGTDHTVLPNSPGGGIGTYVIELRAQSFKGGWYVTTGAGVSLIAVGQFT